MATLPQPGLELPTRLPTRAEPPREAVSASFVLALVLHGALIGVVLAWALIAHRAHANWGEHSMQAGSISATMVPSIPLPPRQLFNKDSVLTSEKPNIAPPPPTAKAEPPPKAHEVLIPEKATPKPPKIADKPAPEPIRRAPPTPPDPRKATTGETPGVRIPEAVLNAKNGTASITLDDRTFGERYAYYARIVGQKVTQSWNTQETVPGASSGMRAIVVFTINVDGTPSDPHIVGRSGNGAFDTAAVRTIQRIDGFGPLPQTRPIIVQFALDYKQP